MMTRNWERILAERDEKCRFYRYQLYARNCGRPKQTRFFIYGETDARPSSWEKRTVTDT